MNDWWAAGIKAQRDWLKASRTSLDAGSAMLGAGDALVAWQEAGRRAADANMAAWKAWSAMGAGLWGGKG